MLGLVDRANVYTENASGVYDVVAKQNLRCRIEHLGGGNTVQERADMAELRHIVWEIGYEMPEDCELQLVNRVTSAPEGPRYNPMPGTFARYRGTNSTRKIRACDLMEVKSG